MTLEQLVERSGIIGRSGRPVSARCLIMAGKVRLAGRVSTDPEQLVEPGVACLQLDWTFTMVLNVPGDA